MNDEKTGFFRQNRDALLIGFLSALVLVIYLQTTGFAFVTLDDNLYIYENQIIKNGLNGETLRWAFASFHSANWHPLTWLSHAADVQLFGLDAGAHHAVNVVLHLINSVLAFVVFRRLTGRHWASLVLAALFAVHPAHVESVAWISERKDVLSAAFWLLTMWAYIIFAESAGEKPLSERIRSNWYAVVFILLALGLMAKPMLVTLPFVLLLCDYWPLGRLRSLRGLLPLVVEKLPLFALSAASSVLTIAAQRSAGAFESFDSLPFGIRAVNAVVSYAKYILTMFYPADLAVMYPYERSFSVWTIAFSAAILIGISALCIWQARARPYLLMGWLWFLGTLVPVIGLVQVGSQAIADRYTYIPYFGLFIMLVWGLSELTERLRLHRFFAYGVIAAVIVAFIALSHEQASYWRNSEALYRHTLAVTRNNYLISYNLCHSFVLEDRLDEAETFCRQSVAIKPDYFAPYNMLGIIDFKRARFAEAEVDFETAVLLAPAVAFSYSNLAQAQSRQGKAEQAEDNLRKAVELTGGAVTVGFANVLSDIAGAYAAKQNHEKSAENLRRVIHLRPNDAEARTRLAFALYSLDRYDEAEAEARNALALRPNAPGTWNTLGLILLRKQNYRDAADAFQKVIDAEPDHPDARTNLARAKAASG